MSNSLQTAKMSYLYPKISKIQNRHISVHVFRMNDLNQIATLPRFLQYFPKYFQNMCIIGFFPLRCLYVLVFASKNWRQKMYHKLQKMWTLIVPNKQCWFHSKVFIFDHVTRISLWLEIPWLYVFSDLFILSIYYIFEPSKVIIIGL